MPPTEEILHSCRKLGLACEVFPTDEMSSILASLACFPMYMVANVDAWTSDVEFRVPVLDWPGAEKIRESFVLGVEEARFDLEERHTQLLRTLLGQAKPSDLVIYEYALDTLRVALMVVARDVAERLRVAIASTVVAVARASGERLGGLGPKITPQEQACIDRIDAVLDLSASSEAAKVLRGFAHDAMSF